MATCRFCKEWLHDVDRHTVKYSTRHYAHWECFFAAGKSVEILNDWQRRRVPPWAVRNVPGVKETLDRLR